MKTKRLIAVIVLSLLGMVMLGHAQEPQFTFNIPVTVESLHPDVDSIRVDLRLTDNSYASFKITSSNPVTVDPATGNFAGTITIATSLPQSLDPLAVTRYVIDLKLHNKNTNEWGIPDDATDTEPWLIKKIVSRASRAEQWLRGKDQNETKRVGQVRKKI